MSRGRSAICGRENAQLSVFRNSLSVRQQLRSAVNEMIEDKRKAGWAFVFLGANQDSCVPY